MSCPSSSGSFYCPLIIPLNICHLSLAASMTPLLTCMLLSQDLLGVYHDLVLAVHCIPPQQLTSALPPIILIVAQSIK